VNDTACTYPKCRHPAVMHTDGKGSCTWPYCECRQHVAPAPEKARA
jgi:hypothetical protein